jgi:hypothetical protein
MFESLRAQLGSGKDRDNIDKLHVRLYMTIKNQSERDFPRGAMRNGLIDGTKCQSEERKGNLFLLLCIANTTHDGEKLQNGLGYSNAKWHKWFKFIKLYLSMEEWFHDCNDKEEVNNARPLIAKVLKWLQELFPREEGTNGYCIPKMHGMTKFQSYIKKYGSAMNFYGGAGESAHKFFVKAPGQKTQRHVSEFAIQTAHQYYDIMVTRHALRSVDIYENIVTESRSDQHQFDDSLRNADEVSVEFSGKYLLVVTNKTIESMRNDDDIYVTWNKDNKKVKKDNVTYCLHR